MIKSYHRGHETYFDYHEYEWCYCGTGYPVEEHSPCARCGRSPTKEGYDACMGHIPGAVSVCCGHGVSEPILIMSEGDEW